MMNYVSEFLVLMLVHILAVMSPGPDLAVTTANSIRFGRHVGMMTAVGIGCGISIHVIYSLLGLSFLQHHPELFAIIRLFGAGYLFYLAMLLIRSKAGMSPIQSEENTPMIGRRTAFLNGFLTNVLNPKVMLFFVSIFTSLVSLNTPAGVKVFYGFWLCASTALWFMFVAIFFTKPNVRAVFLKNAYLFDRVMGVILGLLAIYVAYSIWVE